MPQSYSRRGDDGFTGWLGEGRLSKADARIEALGAVDEAVAALGLARSLVHGETNRSLILQIQRDLYGLMAEVAAEPAHAAKFRVIDPEKVAWLETQIDEISPRVTVPNEFIVPGDTYPAAALDMARAIVRRAERCVAALFHAGILENRTLLQYLNRLSSLCFILELAEIQNSGAGVSTKAKPEK